MKTTKPKTIKVKEDSNNQRLDVFLADKLKISRSQVQKMIAAELVFINGNPPKKSGDTLKTGYEITINKPEVKSKKGDRVVQADDQHFTIDDIKIITQTPDYLVVEKPAGMLTHSTSKNDPDSLAALLSQKYPAIKKVGDDPMRPGIVHRLDKEASGLLVVACTQKMFNHLKEQFKNRTIDKEYIVLTHGKIAKDEDTINFPIARGEHDKMAALPKTKHGIEHDLGKQALTEFWIEKRFINFTLLRVKIHTGRMHQIRVHMLAYDHPVVGDLLYFQKKNKRDLALGRLFLHCTKLGFTDLNGVEQSFESPLPTALQNFLTTVK